MIMSAASLLSVVDITLASTIAFTGEAAGNTTRPPSMGHKLRLSGLPWRYDGAYNDYMKL